MQRRRTDALGRLGLRSGLPTAAPQSRVAWQSAMAPTRTPPPTAPRGFADEGIARVRARCGFGVNGPPGRYRCSSSPPLVRRLACDIDARASTPSGLRGWRGDDCSRWVWRPCAKSATQLAVDLCSIGRLLPGGRWRRLGAKGACCRARAVLAPPRASPGRARADSAARVLVVVPM